MREASKVTLKNIKQIPEIYGDTIRCTHFSDYKGYLKMILRVKDINEDPFLEINITQRDSDQKTGWN